MPELNFKITGDDSSLRKTLDGVATYSKEINDKLVQETSKSLAAGADAIENARRNAEQLSNISLRPPSGTGSIGASIDYSRLTTEANLYGNNASEANRIATEATNRTTAAINGTITAQNTLKAQLAEYRSARGSSTDPATIIEYNNKIKQANAELTKLNNIGKRGYDELGNRIKSTIGQQEILTTKLRYFQSQLNYAKAPESFVALNRKIEQTETQLNKLTNAGRKGFDELGNKIAQTSGGPSSIFLGVLKSIGSAISAAFSVQAIIAWGKEAHEMAAKGEGIREAFVSVGDSTTLEALRKATRGAVSDIDLMAIALRAKNLQIGPELLVKGLDLASKVARQTGQDVTSLTDNLVNSLGSKSMPVLDNLQISQAQISAEMQKTGDVQTAVGNLITERLTEIGDVSITTADKMAQIGTKIANLKEQVGQKINLVFTYDSTKQATDEFTAAGLSVLSLQRNISPLLDKYDELSKKAIKNGGITKLNKDEQALLLSIIKKVDAAVPGSATALGGYGEAIAINTLRAREFIKQQALMAEGLNSVRIKETWKDIIKLSGEVRALNPSLRELKEKGSFTITTNSITATNHGIVTGSPITRQSTPAENKALREKNSSLLEEREKKKELHAQDTQKSLGKILDKKEGKNIKKIPPQEDPAAIAAAAAEKKRLDEAALEKKKSIQAAADAETLSAQENLQKRILAIKEKFGSQNLSKEQEARLAITSEFDKLAAEIEQQGKKYDAYANKYGTKKADQVLGAKQTTKQIEPIRKAAIDDFNYRQETVKFEEEINKQKTIYQSFEEWKALFGEESAQKRFGNELDTSTTYLEKLKKQYSKLIFKSVVGKITNGPGLTKVEQEQLDGGSKLINEAETSIKAKKDREYAVAYKAAETLAQKELSIQEDYQAKVKSLKENQDNVISEEQQKNLDAARDASINSAKEEVLAKSEIYKKLSNETLIVTREQMSGQIKNLRSLLKDPNITGDVKSSVEAQLGNLEDKLNLGANKVNIQSLEERKKDIADKIAERKKLEISSPENAEKIEKLTTDMGDIQGKVDDLNAKGLKGFMDSLKDNKSLASIVKGLREASEITSALTDALGGVDTDAGYALDAIGKLAGAGADVVEGVMSKDPVKIIKGVGTVLSMSRKVKEMNAAARKEVQDFYDSVVKGETDYQALLRKREIDSAGKGKSSYQAIISQLDVLKKQSPEIQAAYDKVFNSLQGGSSKEGVGYKHGTWIRKVKTWDIMASLAGSDYKNLEKLDAQGKLVGVEKAQFDDLKKLKEEIEAGGVATEDFQKQLETLLTGTSTSQLADGLKALFENGQRSAQDFGDSFESIMKNALLNSFKAKYLDDALKPFYEELALMMENGTPSETEIGDLKDKYIGIGKEADKHLKEIEKITGKSLSNKDAPSNTIQGSVQNISANQADVLTGHFAGMRLAQLDGNVLLQDLGLNGIEQLNVAKSNVDVALRIEANTFRTANNTNRLETMEASLASIDAKMSDPDNAKRAAGWN